VIENTVRIHGASWQKWSTSTEHDGFCCQAIRAKNIVAVQEAAGDPVERAATVFRFLRLMRTEYPRDTFTLSGWVKTDIHVPDELLLPRREDDTQKAT
jgi:hypothetical protein